MGKHKDGPESPGLIVDDDMHDPTRATIIAGAGNQRMTHRCVYGYWVAA